MTPGREDPAPESIAATLVDALPESVRWIAGRLEEAGFPTWVVGGAVRNVAAGLPPGEWDLATRARPASVQRLFRRTVPVGLEHGTVGILGRDRVLYEVTTFRRDVRTDGRHAVVEFAETIEEDLARRDFTVNAVAWHPDSGRLYDPHGGLADLAAGVLRTVGEPGERFREDHLRILRALRFAGRFGLEVDVATWRALKDGVGALGTLSRERVREELMKVLERDPGPARALELWRTSGALANVAPELDATTRTRVPGSDGSVWEDGVRTAERVRGRPTLRLAALLAGLGLPAAAADDGVGGDPDAVTRRDAEIDPVGRISTRWRTSLGARRAAALMTRLRFSNAEADRVVALVRAGPEPPLDLSPGDRRRWLSRVGSEVFRDLGRLWIARLRARGAASRERDAMLESVRALRRELRERPPLAVSDLEVDGRDLMRLGMKPGPELGALLRSLLEDVLRDPALNRRDTLLGRASELAGLPPFRGGTEPEAPA